MYGMRSGGRRRVLLFFHNVIRDKPPASISSSLTVIEDAATNLLFRRFFYKQSLSVSTSTDCTACSSKRRSRSCSVWSFGDGNHGALGILPCNSSSFLGGHAYEPTRIQQPADFPNSDVRSICAGHYHSMALTWTGQVWSWGRNDEGQLGRPTNSTSTSTSSREDWGRPRRVEGLDGVNAVAAFASGVVSMVVGEDGSLWTWGKSKRGQLGLGNGIIDSPIPMKVEALAGQNIVKVALGWGHALALTREGKVYGWGYSADGRLGDFMLDSSSSSSAASVLRNNSAVSLMDMAEKMVEEDIEKEKNMPIVWEPSLVPNVNGITVTDISCGLDHSLLLCGSGTLLSGGSNTYGQLGRDDSGSPTMQPVEMGYQPKCVSSGLGHSLALCPANKILSWGWNHNSQLGRGGDPGLPALVEGWDEEISSIRTISAGRAHSVAVTCEGEAFTWGCGRNGRLGLGSPTDEKEPRKVDYLEGMDVQEAVCGFDHTLVLVAE